MSEREAMEQIEILYKSAQGKSIEVLLKEILSNPYLYSFSAFLEWPKIKSYMDSSDSGPFSRLMELFCYGRYKDYISNQGNYIELSSKQISKLRLLTLLSIFENSRNVRFEEMKRELQLDDDEQLEEIIFEGINKEIIKGTISQEERTFFVIYSKARDCRPEELDLVLNKLREILMKSAKEQYRLSKDMDDIVIKAKRPFINIK